MKPVVVAWLVGHGLPAWLAPDYVVLVGLGSLLGIMVHLHLARRDMADVRVDATALMIAYVSAIAGGYVFELMRVLPEAIVSRSLAPFAMVGRAAYGGLLFGILAPSVYLRRCGDRVAPFFDRAAIGTGIIFGFVRTGCFLEGCDFGAPTALPWGVRFPPGSLAAVAHASAGWIPRGAASLPVHPTELYEASVGLLAAAIAAIRVRRGPRDGGAFRLWLAVYAAGRFAIETLRGDVDRGLYLSLSTAQWVSIGLLAWVAFHSWRSAHRIALRPATAAIAALALCVATGSAQATARRHGVGASGSPASSAPATQTAASPVAAPACLAGYAPTPGANGSMVCAPAPTPCPPGLVPIQQPGYPMPVCAPPPALACPAGYSLVQGPNGAPVCQLVSAPAPANTAPPPVAEPVAPAPVAPSPAATPPAEAVASRQQGTHVAARISLAGAITFGRTTVPNGLGAELMGAYRLWIGPKLRFEAGLEGRFLRNAAANQWALGVWAALVVSLGRSAEVSFALVPSQTWIAFDSPFYQATNAWGTRVEIGFQGDISRNVFIGGTPIALGYMNSEAIGTVYTWEPRLWLGAAF